MQQPRLSIIVPAYNEEGRIEKTLIDYLKTFQEDTEIIVIPNGCDDNTVAIIEKTKRNHPRLQYKNFPESILKGGAILEGFKIARGQLIGYVDADGATSAEEFKRLATLAANVDGVIASRRLEGAKIITPPPPIRRLASIIFNLLVRSLFQFSFRDTQCGAKIFQKKVIDDVREEIRTTDWAFDIDLLYRLKKHGYTIQEIPTVWADQEDSKLDVKSVAPRMFLSVIKLRLKYSPLKFLVS